jgi:phosphatidate cytidylyltransferase
MADRLITLANMSNAAFLYLVVGVLFLFGAVLIRLDHGLHPSTRNRRRTDWTKYGIFVLIIFSLLGAASLGRVPAALLLGCIALGATVEIHRNQRGRRRTSRTILCTVVFLLALGHLLAPATCRWPFSFHMAVVLVATTDAFAQLWGRLLGRHKLCPRLSPGKTVEGLLGGLITTAAVAGLLAVPFPEALAPRLVGLGLVTAWGGIGGDLLFSAVKRGAGVKDFSGFLPGHGGLLDRFDSLIVAAPVFYWSQVCLLR